VVAIVDSDEEKVEADLVAGLLTCPDCKGELGPWGHSVRRELRRLVGEESLRPRRSMCRTCRKSHVLLPDSALVRRRDAVEVIGTALLMRAEGVSIARIAAQLGRLVETVRGWLRAFTGKAEAVRSHFTRWARVLDPLGEPIEPAGNAFSDAVSAIGAASRAAVLRFGPRPQWSFLSFLSGGGLLSNTSLLYRAAPIA
jgi:transposase-like protein